MPRFASILAAILAAGYLSGANCQTAPLAENGAFCSADIQCKSGVCAFRVCACQPCPLCPGACPAGQQCVNAVPTQADFCMPKSLKAPGSDCTSSSQCLSSSCVAGKCGCKPCTLSANCPGGCPGTYTSDGTFASTRCATQRGTPKTFCTAAPGAFLQEGSSLVPVVFGRGLPRLRVSMSGDGGTVAFSSPYDNKYAGAVWIYKRASSGWYQEGPKLVGQDIDISTKFGYSLSFSADGSTLAVGGPGDRTFSGSSIGATWVFVRAPKAVGSVSTWTRQGPKLVGAGYVIGSKQGYSVALSADGNTLAVGGYADNDSAGATWVFTRTRGVWSQQGPKLVGTSAENPALQGLTVSLSGNGDTLATGGRYDGDTGAVWVFVRSNGVWKQQGSKLTAAVRELGAGTALSATGDTLVVSAGTFAQAWVFTRKDGTWGNGAMVHSVEYELQYSDTSVSVSADGLTLAVGNPHINKSNGATWVYKHVLAKGWVLAGKLLGTVEEGAFLGGQGSSVSLSADGSRIAIGNAYANIDQGAGWIFTCPSCVAGP